MHPTLTRLDDLARGLSADPSVLALLGLGSAGLQVDRFDDHSDLDFFVVVADPDAKDRLVVGTDWLRHLGPGVAHQFRNDPNGRKALLEDGLLLEYAVFTLTELATIPFHGARVVWSRAPFVLPASPPAPPGTALDTVDFHVDEALTNLLVGLHRELRGERLTAMRFIQVLAVDRLLAVQRLTAPSLLRQPDPFEPTRRVELAGVEEPLTLDRMCAGYGRNAASAGAVLAWLTAHHQPAPSLVGAVQALLDRAAAATAPASEA